MKVLAFVLAGGKGERLFPLTAFRSKPAVPFGGRYRIVDFVLSNLINSGIYSIYLLVQYKSQSLIEHVRQNWVLSPILRDHFIAVVPPQMRMGPEWFQGTADAVFQNLNLLQAHEPDLVVIFGADHIYRMDLNQMIGFHMDRRADVTVAARPVPIQDARAFGVIQSEPDGRITGFQEKPSEPTPMPTDPERAFVSMGNYIFTTDVLVRALIEAQERKFNDFGAHILPYLVEKGSRVYAYDFGSNRVPGTRAYEEQGYWRDVGTIRAYYEAHMEMLGEDPLFELNNPHWPIYPTNQRVPATKVLKAEIEDSIISEGVIIKGATVRRSIIRAGVVIEEGSVVEDCIVMDNTVIKKDCHLKRTIVDKHNVIKEGTRVGFDPEDERFGLHIDPSGIRVIPRKGWKEG